MKVKNKKKRRESYNGTLDTYEVHIFYRLQRTNRLQLECIIEYPIST